MHEYRSRWAPVTSIAGKFGGSPAKMHEWVRNTEVFDDDRIFQVQVAA
jgi:hypothetical protein